MTRSITVEYMMRVVIVTCMCVVVCNSSSAQWQTVKTGIEDRVYSVFFLDDNLGFVGSNSAVLKTTDGGSSWTSHVVSLELHDTITDIHFTSPQIGFATGFYVYRTVDGGQTWETVSPRHYQAGPQKSFQSLTFSGLLHGIAVGTDKLLTTDGGATWAMGDDLFFPLYTTDIQMLEDSLIVAVGWYCGAGGCASSWGTSRDGGKRFRVHQSLSDVGYGMIFTVVHFTDSLNGWIGAQAFSQGSTPAYPGCRLFRTMDGGATWNVCSTGVSAPVSDIVFANSLLGYVSNNGNVGGRIYRTDDGGSTWLLEELPVSAGNKIKLAIGSNVIFAATGKSILKRYVSTSVTPEDRLPPICILPNPSDGKFRVLHNGIVGASNNVTVVDAIGREVYRMTLSQHDLTLDLSPLPRGIYFVTVQSSTSVRTTKLSLH